MFESDDLFKNNCWMKSIKEDTYLSRLSIPGTHDSCTYNVSRIKNSMSIGMVKCQEFNLKEQFNSGVRFFDIRCKQISNKLEIYHGPFYCNMNLDEVLSTFQGLLKDNKSETIIMSVKKESDSEDSSETFCDSFINIVSNYSSLVSLDTIDNPKLKDVQGKVVLVRRFKNDCSKSIKKMGIDLNKWKDNTSFRLQPKTTRFEIQDAYKIGFTDRFKSKWDKIESHLNLARNNKSDDSWIINFTSASGDKGVSLTQMTVLTPLYIACKADIFEHYNLANGANGELINFLKKSDNNGSIGTVVMDFPQYFFGNEFIPQGDLLNLILDRNNEFSKKGMERKLTEIENVENQSEHKYVDSRGINFTHTVGVGKDDNPISDWSVKYYATYDNKTGLETKHERKISIKFVSGVDKKTPKINELEVGIDDWFSMLSSNEDILVLTYDEDDPEHVDLFSGKEPGENTFLVIRISKESESDFLVPIITLGTINAFGWYATRFLPAMQKSQIAFMDEMITDRIEAVKSAISQIDDFRSDLSKTQDSFDDLDRDDGSFWRPGNKDRYDAAKDSIKNCEENSNTLIELWKSKLSTLKDLKIIALSFENFSENIATSYRSQLEIDSSDISKNKTYKPISDPSNGIMIAGGVISAVAPYSPLLFVGLITSFVGSVVNIHSARIRARKLMDWYESTTDKINRVNENLEVEIKTSEFDNKNLQKMWSDFCEIGSILDGSFKSSYGANKLRDVFVTYVDSYTYMMRLESSLYIKMLPNKPASETLSAAIDLVEITNLYTDLVDPRDKKGWEKIQQIKSNRAKAISINYLLQRYGMVDVDDHVKRDEIAIEIGDLTDDATNLKRNIVISILVHSKSSKEVLSSMEDTEEIIKELRDSRFLNEKIA